MDIKKIKDMGDSLINILSGLGTNRDKGSAAKFASSKFRLSSTELGAMYRETSLSRKIVDTPAEDMVRKWRIFDGQGLEMEQIEELNQEQKRLQLKKHTFDALSQSRLYGGALLIPILEGTGGLDEPLTIDMVKQGSLKAVTVVDASWAFPFGIVNENPYDVNYLLPDFYSLSSATERKVHHSRIIRFDGEPLPRREFERNRYWGESILEVVYNEMKRATTVADSTVALMHELNLDMISIEGLSNALSAGQEAQIKNRLEAHTLAKSMFNTVIMDSTETFSNRTMPVAGMDALVQLFYNLLAGAADIPVTRLMGTSPDGMNATGEGDLRNYYDMISSKQETRLAPQLHKFDMIMAKSLFGDLPDDLSFSFNPLWQESSQDRADRTLKEAQRDTIYLQDNVITEDIVAKQLVQEGTYSNITPEFIEQLESELNNPDTSEDI